MSSSIIFACLSFLTWLANASTAPTVVDTTAQITYHGLSRNGIDVFLNIPYGEDTGGQNRFKPPKAHVSAPGSIIKADKYGPSCPQDKSAGLPLFVTPADEISENCLNLNIARPKNASKKSKLPVMVYIYGGSFWVGQNKEVTTTPDGLVIESIHNGHPIIHVSMTYRLGVFGFATSNALHAEGSQNAGLRDQRLAIEWVRDNILEFGGDPENITIFGQSSGGLAVGLHILAYGGKKPVPFQKGICQSQALEPGITKNFTLDAMATLVAEVACTSTDLHSEQIIACLRHLSMDQLLKASIKTYKNDITHNIGDIWLPTVDGDFLPDAPSQLLKAGRFANVTAMMGWCEDDLDFFTDTSIKTADDTRKFMSGYMSGVSKANLEKLLSLYPSSEFKENPKARLSSEFYRSARIFRDILMVCEPLLFGKHLAAAKNDVYLYDWNQTILEPVLEAATNQTGLGVVHTSEYAYIFGNLSHYNFTGIPFHPSESDYKLQSRGSRSWSFFATKGQPGAKGLDTFQGFKPAFSEKSKDVSIFVAGGSQEGLSAIEGCHAQSAALQKQKLAERCEFINSAEMIVQLGF